MVDERTASVVTNINTAKRSSQSIRMVRDHVRIRGFHRVNLEVCCAYFAFAQSLLAKIYTQNKAKPKPVVKWRDMTSTIHGPDIDAPSRKEHLVSQHADDAESASELDMDSGELNDGLTWLDGPPPDLTNIERHEFNVAKHIDITSPYLLDILADTPAVASGRVLGPGQARDRPVTQPLKELMTPDDGDWGKW
jgi:hypothetical protein